DLRLADLVAVELEDDLAVVAFNGENLGENGLQPGVLAPGGGRVAREEFLVGIDLQFDQVGWGDNLADLSEVNPFRRAVWHGLGCLELERVPAVVMPGRTTKKQETGRRRFPA